MPDSHLLLPLGPLLLFSVAAFARHQAGSWLAPGAFFALFWACVVSYSTLVYGDLVSVAAALWIVTSVVFVVAGGLVTRTASPHARPRYFTFELPYIRLIVIVSVCFGLVAVSISIGAFGFSLASLLSLDEHLRMTTTLSNLRFNGLHERPWLAQVLLTFVYGGPMFAGVFNGISARKGSWRLSVAAISPALLVAATETTRSALLNATILWLSGWLAGSVARHRGRVSLFGFRRAAGALAGALTMLASSMVLRMLREAQVGTQYAIEKLMRTLRDAAEPMPVFSIWFQRFWASDNLLMTFGTSTFSGLAHLLGVKRRGLISFEGDLYPGLLRSTYEPLLQALLSDFTAPGCLAILFVCGMISERAFRNAASGRLRAVPILIVFYCTTLWCHIAVLLSYNSILAAVLMLVGYFTCLREPKAIGWVSNPNAASVRPQDLRRLPAQGVSHGRY